jgi:hypothetical protein
MRRPGQFAGYWKLPPALITLWAMNTASKPDIIIRFLSPEMAAAKLGWTLARVLKRREELGLGPLAARRFKRRPEGKPATVKAAKRKPAGRQVAAQA